MTDTDNGMTNGAKAAGVVGAVVGVGLAVAATHAIAKKKNRQAILHTARTIKAKVVEVAKKKVPKKIKKYIRAATS